MQERHRSAVANRSPCIVLITDCTNGSEFDLFRFRFRILSVQPPFVCLLNPFDTPRVIGLVGRDSVLTYLVDLGEADPVVAASTHRRQ